jgi:hypothetical protein
MFEQRSKPSRRHPLHKPAGRRPRGRVAYPTTDNDRRLLAAAPRRQHADEYAHAERDSNDLIRMLADSLVSNLRSGDGFFLQAFANLLGLFGCGFQFGSKFALLALSTFCCFHKFFLS